VKTDKNYFFTTGKGGGAGDKKNKRDKCTKFHDFLRVSIGFPPLNLVKPWSPVKPKCSLLRTQTEQLKRISKREKSLVKTCAGPQDLGAPAPVQLCFFAKSDVAANIAVFGGSSYTVLSNNDYATPATGHWFPALRDLFLLLCSGSKRREHFGSSVALGFPKFTGVPRLSYCIFSTLFLGYEGGCLARLFTQKIILDRVGTVFNIIFLYAMYSWR